MATRCFYDDEMFSALARLNPFKTAEGRRLGLLFAVVYFAQGMWYLPNQTITIVFKDAGYNVARITNFFVIAGIPWLIEDDTIRPAVNGVTYPGWRRTA